MAKQQHSYTVFCAVFTNGCACNNGTATEEQSFHVVHAKMLLAVQVDELVRGLLWFSCCDLFLLEAGS
jgi:hypothetical protein